MHQHPAPTTTPYLLKLIMASVVVALLSGAAVLAYASVTTVSADAASAVPLDIAPLNDDQVAAAPAAVDQDVASVDPVSTDVADDVGQPEANDDGVDAPAADGLDEAAPAEADAPDTDHSDPSAETDPGETPEQGDDHAGEDHPLDDDTTQIECPAGTWPVGDACAFVDCNPGFIYNGTECEAICETNTTWNGTHCEPNEPAPIDCPEGTWPVGDACAFVDCNPGFIYNGTECEAICETNTTWNGTHCEPNEPAPIECSGGAVAVGDRCVIIDCIHGFILRGAECVPATADCGPDAIPTQHGCSPLDCGAGYVLAGGLCYAPCDNRTLNVNGDCLDVQCATGYGWNGVRCAPNGPACPQGQVLLGGVCTQIGVEAPNDFDLGIRPDLIDPGLIVPGLDLGPALPTAPLFGN